MLVQTLRSTWKERKKKKVPLCDYSVLFHECCYIDTQLTWMHGLGSLQGYRDCSGQTRGGLFVGVFFPPAPKLQVYSSLGFELGSSLQQVPCFQILLRAILFLEA